MCKILKTVCWCSLVNKCKSRYRLVVCGVMGYYLFTVDAGVRFCFCSVGVGVLSYDLARRNYLVELWTVLSGKERCLFLLLCCKVRINGPSLIISEKKQEKSKSFSEIQM